MDLKIRLFALAKELGIDSKDLIEHCNSAGLKVKNSPLASISPEERDLVLGHLKNAGSSVATAPPEEAQMTPFARDTAREVGRIRSIRPVVSPFPPCAASPPRPAVESRNPFRKRKTFRLLRPTSRTRSHRLKSCRKRSRTIVASEPQVAVEPGPCSSIGRTLLASRRSPLLRRSGSGTEISSGGVIAEPPRGRIRSRPAKPSGRISSARRLCGVLRRSAR